MNERDLFFGFQHTVAQEFELFGNGLMSGAICSVRIKPAPEDTGIIFRVEGDEDVKLSINTTKCEYHSIALKAFPHDVMYIEHLISTFFSFGVDNAIVEVIGSEIPFYDGSALIFSERLMQVGLMKQNSIRRYGIITEHFEISDGFGYIRVEPSDEFIVHGVYRSPSGKREEFLFSQDVFFPDDIAPARTFIYDDDLKRALEVGLFRGGNTDSAVIFSKDEDKPINTELRYENERVRHKILDFLGDIYSSGLRLLGKFYFVNASHSLTRNMLKNIKFCIL